MNITLPRIKNIKPKRVSLPGEIPGSFEVTETSFPSKLFVYAYNSTQLDELETTDIKEAVGFFDKFADRTFWLDVKGLGTQEVLDFIQKHFDVNLLVMEDIVQTHQRPKNEEYDNYLYVISRMLELDKGCVQVISATLTFSCKNSSLGVR
jgi:magnesium transporter